MNKRTSNRVAAAVGAGLVLVAALGVSISAVGAVDAPTSAPVSTVAIELDSWAVPERPDRGVREPVEVPVAPTPVPAPPVVLDRLVLVGDSLAHESAAVVDHFTPDMVVVGKYWGGTAPCDWLDVDLEATATSVVVITFTGNNVTPCMLDAAGERLSGDRLVDKYRADVGVLVERARAVGAWVVLVGQPQHHPRLGVEGQIAGINAAYRDLADQWPKVAFVDAGAAVESADGSYTDRLPCTDLDTDCAADGTTVVRGDGVHFCPIVEMHSCPVWSSGAMRYGLAIATAAADPQRLD